jgi:hypothetical protein
LGRAIISLLIRDPTYGIWQAPEPEMTVHPHTILIVLRAVQKVFPPPPLEQATSRTMDELKAKYRWTDLLANLLVLPMWAVAAGALTAVFWELAWWYYRSLPKTVFLLKPPAEFLLALGAVFIAFYAAPLVTLYVIRWWMGTRWPEYYAYACQRANLDAAKVLWLLFLVVTPPTLLGLALLTNGFTAFTEQAILHKPFWSLSCREHPYTEVRGVYAIDAYHARFEDVVNPQHAIRFADGTMWTTRDNLRQPTPEVDDPVIRYVAERARCPVQKVRFVEDIPR